MAQLLEGFGGSREATAELVRVYELRQCTVGLAQSRKGRVAAHLDRVRVRVRLRLRLRLRLRVTVTPHAESTPSWSPTAAALSTACAAATCSGLG